MEVGRIGMDIAKKMFQVHGGDAPDKVIVRSQLRRSKGRSFFAQLPVWRMGLEACGRAQYWGRELQQLGQDLRRIAVQLIKPYRTKPKNDRHDAEAICAAGSRPQRRFVPIKMVEQTSRPERASRPGVVGERTTRRGQPDPGALRGVRPRHRSGDSTTAASTAGSAGERRRSPADAGAEGG